MTEPSLNTTGFTVVHDPDRVFVDIVFIHGLQGHPSKTWTSDGLFSPPPSPQRSCPRAPEEIQSPREGVLGFFGNIFKSGSAEDITQPHQVFWPKDLLAKEKWCNHARILTYGYDSTITKPYKSTNKNSLFAHANDLLYELSRTKPEKRPVIFVVHSLGGLILKDVLRRSRASNETGLRDVVRTTKGIVFLGTPHRGSPELASLTQTVTYLASAIARVDANSQLLRALGTDSPELELGQDDFISTWNRYKFRVKTFKEAHALTGVRLGPMNRLVVPPMSSSLGDPREHAESINADHKEMCKFANSSDSGYVKVSAEIRTMVGDCTRFSWFKPDW